MGYVNTISEPTGSGNQSSDKISTKETFVHCLQEFTPKLIMIIQLLNNSAELCFSSYSRTAFQQQVQDVAV